MSSTREGATVGIESGAGVGGAVGFFAAIFSGFSLFQGQMFDACWLCSWPWMMLLVVIVASVAGAIPGLIGGFVHGLTHRPQSGSLAGLIAGVVMGMIVFLLASKYGMPQREFVAATVTGFLAGILGGVIGGRAPMYQIRDRGQRGVPERFRLPRFFWSRPKPKEDPETRWKKKPPDGIEPADDGTTE